MIAPATARDLDTFRAHGPLYEGEDSKDYPRGQPCVRLSFVTDGNLTERDARLDEWLARAAELARPEVKLYGGGGESFPSSQRRRPKASDWALFDGLSDRLAEELRMGLLEEPQSIPQEAGSCFFGDSLGEGESATRFFMIGSHPWRVSLALSLDLWAQNAAEMDTLVEDLAVLGDVYDSGGYGFAMNFWTNSHGFDQYRLLHPVSQRFALIDMINPQRWPRHRLESLGAGGKQIAPFDPPLLYPIMPWNLFSTAALRSWGIAPQTIRALSAEVHEVQEHEHGFLVKLWPGPILGMPDTDLAPARALARALAPALVGAQERIDWSFPALLGWSDVASAWYRRFVPGHEQEWAATVGLGNRD